MMPAMKRPDPTKMAEDLFSKLDTSSQGYIQKSDLQAAFNSISSDASSSASDLFSQLDADGDNKITKQEFTEGLKNLASQFDNAAMDQYRSDSAQRGDMGGMPPPPPPPPPPPQNESSSTSSTDEVDSTDSSSTSLSASLEKKLMQQIAQLMQAYAVGTDQDSNGLQSSLSISA
jgi:hypothetical protein